MIEKLKRKQVELKDKIRDAKTNEEMEEFLKDMREVREALKKAGGVFIKARK